MTKSRLSWPNRITIARIMMIVPFVMCVVYIQDPRYNPWPRYGALTFFFLMSISDALDGWLARRNHDITALGTFLDPLADKLLITTSFLILATDYYCVPNAQLPKLLVVLVISKDLYSVLGFFAIYLVTSQVKVLRVKIGKWCTAMELTLILAVLAAPDATRVFPKYTLFLKAFWTLMAALGVLTMLFYTHKGARFLSEYEHQQTLQQLKNSPQKKPPSQQ